VVEHEPEDGIPALRSGELDVLVSESYEGVAAVPTGGLESHELLAEPLQLVLPRGDATPEPVPLASLTDAPWIAGLAGPGSRRRSTWPAGRRGSHGRRWRLCWRR
jgi:hypothetical protein